MSVERAATTLIKRCSYLTQGVASLITKEILISVETAAATLIKRYSYLTTVSVQLALL